MKCNILLESFGPLDVRLSLVHGQDEIAMNLFQNLKWIVSHYEIDESESFMTTREKLISAIKAFRASNITQTRRGYTHKGQWRQSPFSFEVMSQTSARDNVRDSYAQGTIERDEVMEAFNRDVNRLETLMANK